MIQPFLTLKVALVNALQLVNALDCMVVMLEGIVTVVKAEQYANTRVLSVVMLLELLNDTVLRAVQEMHASSPK